MTKWEKWWLALIVIHVGIMKPEPLYGFVLFSLVVSFVIGLRFWDKP